MCLRNVSTVACVCIQPTEETILFQAVWNSRVNSNSARSAQRRYGSLGHPLQNRWPSRQNRSRGKTVSLVHPVWCALESLVAVGLTSQLRALAQAQKLDKYILHYTINSDYTLAAAMSLVWRTYEKKSSFVCSPDYYVPYCVITEWAWKTINSSSSGIFIEYY